MEIRKNDIEMAPVIGTDDREALTKKWYVLVVQMNCEKKAAMKLKALGHDDIYVPIHKEVHFWSDRRKVVDKIVIPMMVFLKIQPEKVNDIKKLSFVFKLLTAPGERAPAIIPDHQVDRLKYMLGNADSEITIEKITINKDDKVRIRRGSLRGMEGYACHGSDGKMKLAIIIDYLGCACVQVSVDDLERVD